MTRPLSVFIDFRDDLATLAEFLGQRLGGALVRTEDDRGVIYRGRALDVELALYADHGLEDDAGIAFTRYRCQLQLIALRDGLTTQAYARLYEDLALYLAERSALELGCPSMVVANLQRTLASYPV